MTPGDGIKPAIEVFCPSNVAYSLWGGLITVSGRVGWLREENPDQRQHSDNEGGVCIEATPGLKPVSMWKKVTG